MVFQRQAHDMLEVTMVNMGIHPKKPFENDFYDRHKTLRKRNSYQLIYELNLFRMGSDYQFKKQSTDLTREKGFVVDLTFHPGHQIINILTCRDFERFPDILPISPQVFISNEKGYLGPALITGQVSALQNSI